jgi:hypothetical protein
MFWVYGLNCVLPAEHRSWQRETVLCRATRPTYEQYRCLAYDQDY